MNVSFFVNAVTVLRLSIQLTALISGFDYILKQLENKRQREREGFDMLQLDRIKIFVSGCST